MGRCGRGACGSAVAVALLGGLAGAAVTLLVLRATRKTCSGGGGGKKGCRRGERTVGVRLPFTSLWSVKQLGVEHVQALIDLAEHLRGRAAREGGQLSVLQGKVLANVFYEPSTRTSCSFNAAMQRLGGRVVEVSGSTSSVKKGETLQDTVRCLACYCDGIVLRHPEKGAALRAADAVPLTPVVNAGDGAGEHPTQALLDAYTVWRELEGGVAGKLVCMVGDLKHGRTVHSLARLLALFPGVRLVFVAPPSLRLPEDVKDELRALGVGWREEDALDEVLAAVDVLYVTRVQRERFESEAEFSQVEGAYTVTAATLRAAKPDMRVLHPLPRVNEIAEDVDADPRAAYFRQMENGMYMRMALLLSLLSPPPPLAA